ncbi:MAG TPA: cell division protein ZipA C-terminal FtsZ-binding domain-containing protein [Methylophilaceae bacterium]|nr:cell division protein ZipA C-terminal FtsZ-binding domain-containing protein [Methylophilaceae bacterium]
MSDLQLALLVLGALIIAAVVLFNWWQERRIIREAMSRIELPADDSLRDDFHFDPEAVSDIDSGEAIGIEADLEAPEAEADFSSSTLSVADDDWDPAVTAGISVGDDAPVTDEGADSLPGEVADADIAHVAEPSAELTTPGELPSSFDLRIDLVAMVRPDSPAGAEALLRKLQPLPEFERHTQWFGRDEGGVWHSLLAAAAGGVSFTEIACALQLADRSGPISKGALQDFQSRIEQLASSHDAVLGWLGEANPWQYAFQLDQFCISVDVMVGLHIVQAGNGPFAGTKLRGLAEAGGMKLHDDGQFHFETETGETLFVLVDHDRHPFSAEMLRTAFVRGVSLQLDVPRVGNCIEAFNQMALLARQMESGLRGVLVDDNQRALGDADIEKIRQQLRSICVQMGEHGIQPGSPLALRLFS